MNPGEIHRQEMVALELEIRRSILDCIGFDKKSLEEIEDDLKLNEEELRNHLFVLERGLLVDKEEGCYRLSPRCVAYLNEMKAYEWRR